MTIFGKEIMRTGVFVLFLTCIVLSSTNALIENHGNSNNASAVKPKSDKLPAPKANSNKDRSIELPEWRANQSRSLGDYLDIKNPLSFLRQPVNSKGFQDVTSRFCSSNVRVVILIISSAKNIKQRKAIRTTWGSAENTLSKGVRTVFVLGEQQQQQRSASDSDAAMQKNLELEAEASQYNDIVQEDFVDTYQNLTLKSIAMLKWINLTCSLDSEKSLGPEFILKSNDDIFVNVDRILALIDALPQANIVGHVTCHTKPYTNWRSKWYVPNYIFPASEYPGYAHGCSYLIRGKIIPTLLNNAMATPLVNMEDVYITSLIATPSNIYPHNSNLFAGSWCSVSEKCSFRIKVNMHGIKPDKMLSAWATLNDTSLSCPEKPQCKLPTSSDKPMIC